MLKERLRVSTISLRLRCIRSECRQAHRKKKKIKNGIDLGNGKGLINNWKERSKNRADWERAIKEAKVRIGL
jgi:hypothetical protein